MSDTFAYVKFVADVFGDFLQGFDVGISIYGQGDDLVTNKEFFDSRLFSIFWEVVDRVDARFDLIAHIGGVVAALHFNEDGTVAFSRCSGDFLYAFDVLYAVFDQLHDAAFHLLRRGSRVGDCDAHCVEVEFREKLQLDRRSGE